MFFKIYFKLQVIYKSYRQELTSSNNSQLLLKLEILTSSNLLQSNGTKTKETATFSSLLRYARNGSFDDLEPLHVGATTLAALHAQAFSLGDAYFLNFFCVVLWNRMLKSVSICCNAKNTFVVDNWLPKVQYIFKCYLYFQHY